MKSRFTSSVARVVLSFCILSMAAMGALQAQNGSYTFDDQNNTDALSGQMAASSRATSMRIVLDQRIIAGTKVLSGNLVFSLPNSQAIYNIGAALNYDSTSIDPESFQFDLGQADLGELYKLLALYKSEAGTGGGHTIVTLSRKNKSGKAVDSIYIVFKYVVADDLSGFAPAVGSIEPVIVGARISNTANNASLFPNSSSTLQVNGAEALIHPDFSGLITLYPNPAQNAITVDLNTLSGSDIRIYNMQGKLVKTVPSMLTLPQHKIDIADLPAGIYILNIDTQSGPVEKTFSKIN